VTGLVDLEGGRLLDVVADRTRAAVDRWLGARPHDWLAGITTVALDPWRGYASALVVPLGHATVVVDHFHAIRLANTVVDQVRRRTQQATLSGIGVASQIRCTASASCCSPRPSSSLAGGECGCGPGWPPVTLVARW
jgi:transposase